MFNVIKRKGENGEINELIGIIFKGQDEINNKYATTLTVARFEGEGAPQPRPREMQIAVMEMCDNILSRDVGLPNRASRVAARQTGEWDALREHVEAELSDNPIWAYILKDQNPKSESLFQRAGFELDNEDRDDDLHGHENLYQLNLDKFDKVWDEIEAESKGQTIGDGVNGLASLTDIQKAA
jgi:hypothetical protein